ncbi:MAG TPA: cytochrome c1 [Gammaproteobacteria bacterium]|nr:cytochrome c1 [Gammaproteobacteria bacterium]
MDRRFQKPLLALLLTLPGLVFAAAPGVALQSSGADVSNQASLQRGAQLYMNYCAGCHSLQYVRYNTLADGLGLSDEQVAENLRFTGTSPHEQIRIAMPAEDAAGWFGLAPPDLSLIARARGTDYVFTFLKSFYADPGSRATGANNKVLAGTAMPHVLWELQGVQEAVYRQETGADGVTRDVFDRFELVRPGSMTPEEFDQAARDITAFLSWAAEPMQVERKRLGTLVLLFLLVLFAFSYLYYKELWKDVK